MSICVVGANGDVVFCLPGFPESDSGQMSEILLDRNIVPIVHHIIKIITRKSPMSKKMIFSF